MFKATQAEEMAVSLAWIEYKRRLAIKRAIEEATKEIQEVFGNFLRDVEDLPEPLDVV